MYFRIKKGQEHKLMVSKDIHDTNAFMYPAYQQALLALKNNIDHSKAFDKQDFCSELYGYSQNIIVFSGRRGQGKTSTMMSFSNAMKTNALDKDDAKQKFFSDCSFDVLPPIDPTLMEGNQSILGVILSRMYRMAENRWRNSSGGCGYLSCDPTEAQKNELLKLFQTCLNGIAAVSASGNDPVKSLRQINELSDSSVLKQNIYLLTQKLLSFIATDSKEHRYLVIQLDDTDFQIQKGYLYLEEIRKYFTIPNVIILMATDMKLLRKVICQYFFDEFDTLVYKHKIMAHREIEQVVRKYLDKLIAPSHVVHLPKLDDKIVSSGDLAVLCYEGHDQKNLLIKDANVEKEENISAQALILRYIYRKTGIVFAAPSSFYHHILPTTIRGLGQLLDLLSSMEDVPSVDFAKNESISEDAYISQLRNHVANRVAVLETNLPKFENYFLNEWLDAKLQGERAEIIRELSHAAVKESIPYIAKRLREFYKPEEEAIKNASKITTHADLYALIEMYEKQYHALEDFCFLFSIRTYFTIMYHKIALRQMRTDLDNHNAGEPLVFDFSPETTGLPDSYAIPNFEEKVIGKDPIFSSNVNIDDGNTDQESFVMNNLCSEYHLLITKDQTGYYFSFMNFITLALSLGNGRNKFGLLPPEIPQTWYYVVQISALAIAVNWDIQRKIFEKWEDINRNGLAIERVLYRDLIVKLYTTMDEVITQINKGHKEFPNMLDIKIHKIFECVSSNGNNTYIDSIASCFRKIQNSLGINNKYLTSLRNIYNEAKTINAALKEVEAENAKIMSVEPRVSAFLDDFNTNLKSILGTEEGINDDDFSPDMSYEKPDQTGTIALYSPDHFWSEFMRLFTKMCSHVDIAMDDIIEA